MVPIQKASKQAPSKLTERGGIGLVMFHLARLRIEFVIAHEGSSAGDIWAQTRAGKIGIEVKTTLSQSAWHVSRRQLGAADVYCLVNLSDAVCYLLPSADVVELVAAAPDVYPGIACLKQSVLPLGSRNGWRLLREDAIASVRLLHAMPPRVTLRKAPRRVVHRLKNGEQKIYEYPAYR